jgi:uncharacterized membrane protein YvlD (DUF360 family)
MSTTATGQAPSSGPRQRTSLERRLGTRPKRPGPIHRTAAVWKDEYDTLVNWPRGARHLLARGSAYVIVNAIALIIAAAFMPGFEISGGFPVNVFAAVMLTLVAGAITFLVRPLVFLVLPQHIVVTAVLTVVFMGLSLQVASWFMREVQIDGLVSAIFVSVIVAGIGVVLSAVVGLDEDESFYRHSLKRMARSSGDVDDRPGPGFVIIQVDGLAEPILRNALRTGYMPFLADWLSSGAYRLGTWEALAPSMTSAGQVGILHGAHAGIPAFRWWEKERDYLMVSNHPDDALEIERRASAEHDGEWDLLKDGGTSISNLVSGGATRAIATNSQLAKGGQGLQVGSFSLFLYNPYNLTRGAAQFVGSVVAEYFQARRQRVRDIRPRISRGWPFPLLKASTTTIMRDMLIDLVIGEMGRGTPIVYADYLGYDEVAHHAGPERPESMDQLDRVDRMVRSLSKASVDAPRPYHFILVSDHGQTQGAPFEDRYGISLEALVRGLMEGEVTSLDATNDVEGWGGVNSFLTEASRAPGTSGRIMRSATRRNRQDGIVELGDTDEHHKGAHVEGVGGAEKERIRQGETVPDLVVAASGNLANIYFPAVRERLSLEGIARAHPELLPGLVRHRGVGFIMVRSEEQGALVISADGMRNLDTGEVEGRDPLEHFGPHAVHNLRRLDSYEHIGDIFIISMYDPSTDEIAPFEHQVGAHGGLGGMQTKAFVMYPAVLAGNERPVALVGAEQVNVKIREWIARAQELYATGGAPEAEPEAGPEALPSVLRKNAPRDDRPAAT